MQLVGPHEQIEAACSQVDVALRVLQSACDVLISDRKDLHTPRASLGQALVDLRVLRRELRDIQEELTPVRPASRTDIRAAFDTSSAFTGSIGTKR